MKKTVIRYLLRFSYPQNVFAEAIIRFIDVKSKDDLIDVPCGDGITSWQFSRLNNLIVYGYDISSGCIQNAKRNFYKNNLFFEEADIKQAILKHSGVKYFCIINSLFLLPEPDSILNAVHNSIRNNGLLFIIVPNTEGPNFKWFEKHNPGINRLILAESEFQSYFSSNCWNLQKTIPLAYIRTFSRKDLAFLSVFAPLYLSILNYFQTLFKANTSNYFLLVMQKA
jgi:2-polyprenyl-3-methyl-5-hydroxy-6-metoxy-1,4-benzoquinol methylase